MKYEHLLLSFCIYIQLGIGIITQRQIACEAINFHFNGEEWQFPARVRVGVRVVCLCFFRRETSDCDCVVWCWVGRGMVLDAIVGARRV